MSSRAQHVGRRVTTSGAGYGVPHALPIVHVTHDEEDGAWQFHSVNGAYADLKEHRLVALDEILARDQMIAELAYLPFGWRALRVSHGAEWRRERNPPE